MGIILVIVVGMLTQNGDYSTKVITLDYPSTLLICEQTAQRVLNDDAFNQPDYHILSATCTQEK